MSDGVKRILYGINLGGWGVDGVKRVLYGIDLGG